MKKDILRIVPALIALVLGGCGGTALPPPNTVQARFDPQVRAVQIVVSELDRTTQAELVGADGAPVQAGSVGLVSVPHVYYNLPCGGLAGQAAVPPGGPPPICVAEQSDQYVVSASIPAPADYAQRWTAYRVRLRVGSRSLTVAAPPPTTG